VIVLQLWISGLVESGGRSGISLTVFVRVQIPLSKQQRYFFVQGNVPHSPFQFYSPSQVAWPKITTTRPVTRTVPKNLLSRQGSDQDPLLGLPFIIAAMIAAKNTAMQATIAMRITNIITMTRIALFLGRFNPDWIPK
jgi:hypothetical protein